MRCLRFIKFSRLHLHKALYKAARHQAAEPPRAWRPPLADASTGEVRGAPAALPPTHPSDPPCPCQEEGLKARRCFPYNQIFTALSDRFLSHLRDLFICESISIVQ